MARRRGSAAALTPLQAASQTTPRYHADVVDRTLSGLISDTTGRIELLLGDPSTIVTGVGHDSRHVDAGGLFVAVPGFTVDGHNFLAQAVAAGASALLVQRGHESSWRDVAPATAILVADDSRRELSAAAAWFYGHPSRELPVIGVTGTDGKTTTSYLLTALFEHAGFRVGRLGTVDAYIGGAADSSTARMTTPEAPEVQRLLRRMVDAGCTLAIVESTSHGLALLRLADVDYDVAVFTNITGDHLDFHETFEAYREAKSLLFSALEHPPLPGRPLAAVVNYDDPSANFMLAKSRAKAIRFGLHSPEADITARDIDLRSDGSTFTLVTPEGASPVELRIPAVFNVENALAAAATGVAFGLSPSTIAAGLERCPGIPGRMERVHAGQPFEVIVDYAHTGDAVRKVLSVLRVVTPGRLTIVVGAAGERDPGRRFGVGRAAAELADFAVFTSEDPRSEDPATIVREIGSHAEGAGRVRGQDFVEIQDRREAIARAFATARIGDTVVVAGKGHEQSMIFGGQAIPWDDRVVAREELARLGYTG